MVFLFSGVGEQHMTQDLYEQEEIFRQAADYCCTFLYSRLGLDLHSILFPENPPAKLSNSDTQRNQGKLDLRMMLGRETIPTDSNMAEHFTTTALAQPATFVIEYALTQLLMQWGIRPQALLGYSLGEYVAACVSGVLSLEEALLLVARRAQLIQTMPSGAMVAVPLSEEEVQPYLSELVCLAAVNGPRLCVLAGPIPAIGHIEAQLGQQEMVSVRLNTTHAFHSTMLVPLKEAVTELMQKYHLQAPQIPYISNVTGTWITEEQATDPAYWAEHMCRPVRFSQGLEHLLQADVGEQLLLEIGPGKALSSMVQQHPACGQSQRALVFATLPSAYERQSAYECLQVTLSKLWLVGVKINTE